MSRITLTDVRSFLQHLLAGDRRAEVAAIEAAAGYLPVLDRTLAGIVALPPGPGGEAACF